MAESKLGHNESCNKLDMVVEGMVEGEENGGEEATLYNVSNRLYFYF
jgi:hypothetical protein